MVEGGAGRGARTAAQKCNLTEVAAAGEVGEHQFAAGTLLRDFYKADADEVKAVGWISLPTDYLSGIETQEFDAIAQVSMKSWVSDLKTERCEQLRVERAAR